MSLSVCLLTRNEEKKLPTALKSVAGLADEVLVADTGSTDQTVTVAQGLGARVVPVPWDDDFAAASNFALAQAAGDWVLWLNPDEELEAASQPVVRACLTRDEALGFYASVLDQVKPDRPGYGTVTLQLRLFRRHPDLRYVGRLHPRFEVPLEELARREGKQVYQADIGIRRHGYLSAPTPDKLRWACRLLEKELQDRPGQTNFLIEYGRNLLWLNDPRGHEILAEAERQLLPHRNDPGPPAANAGLLLEYLLTATPEQSRCRLSAADALELARRWFPLQPPLVWAVAQYWFRKGDFRQAAEQLEKLVRFGAAGAYDRSAGFDPAIIGTAALMNLGICALRLGQWGRAEECFRRAEADAAYQAQARQNLDLLADLRRRHAAGTADPPPAGP